MTNAQEKKENHSPTEHNGTEQPDTGRSGEGAASAMQQLISQNLQHRHQTGEADDAAGGHGQ